MKKGAGTKLRLTFYVILALGLVFIMIFGEKIGLRQVLALGIGIFAVVLIS